MDLALLANFSVKLGTARQALSDSESRAMVTAGLANEVDAVSQPVLAIWAESQPMQSGPTHPVQAQQASLFVKLTKGKRQLDSDRRANRVKRQTGRRCRDIAN